MKPDALLLSETETTMKITTPEKKGGGTRGYDLYGDVVFLRGWYSTAHVSHDGDTGGEKWGI